jgi:aerotolerance regulator-like protein/VWA domain-containing protein
MNFINPLVLFGLFAASIPVILHLLNLRKLKRVEFSSLRFLKELQKTKIRRLRLKQIILLILRTLIIIFAVIAFARPTIDSTIPGMGSSAKTSAIILIDNSFSMDISDEGGNRFNQAMATAREIINNLTEGDEVTILGLAEESDFIIPKFSREFGNSLTVLNEMQMNIQPGNITEKLRLAASLMENSLNVNKEIFLISDQQNNLFDPEQTEELDLFSSNTTIYNVAIGRNSQSNIQNISIDSLKILNRIFDVNKLVETEIDLQNHSQEDIDGVVVSMFYNDDRVAQRSTNLSSEARSRIAIASAPQLRGLIKGKVELEPDALNIDNSRYFGFIIPAKPRIAIFGSNGSTEFIRIALGERGVIESPANYSIFRSDELSGKSLNDFAMIIIAGGSYSKSDFERINDYASQGGGVLIFASEDPTLPAGLQQLGFGESQQRNYSQDKPAEIKSIEKIHPLFEGVFKGTTDNRKVVESPKIFTALVAQGGQEVIGIPGGKYMSELRIGEGKVFYLATPPDLSWSSLPLTGIFPTLLYRSINYLSTTEQLGYSVNAGEELRISLAKKYGKGGNYTITDPNGLEYFQKAVSLPSGDILDMGSLKLPGVYVVGTSDGKPLILVSVNIDPSESDLIPMTEENFELSVSDLVSEEVRMIDINRPREILSGIQRSRTGTELWQLFVILAIITAIAEMLVGKATRKDTEIA